MTTSTYSTSSNSPGFNPILQKFHKMICLIIFSETVCRIFLIFCCSCFINDFVVRKFFGTAKSPKDILRPIYLRKLLHTVLKILSAKISQKDFFSKNKKISKDLELFSREQSHWFKHDFFAQELNFILFFQMWSFNFNTLLKICFINLF